MNLFEVRAAAGRRVRDPATGNPIPAVGEDTEPAVIAWDSYWGRRQDDGDVVATPYVEPKSKPVKE